MSASVQALSGVRKAAIVLVILGDEAASSIYKNLPEEDLRVITREISELDYISPEMAEEVLREYHRLTLTQEYLAQGGSAYAIQLLTKSFGEGGAKALLDQVSAVQEKEARNLATLQRADPQQLVKFIQGEHPQTIALVLAHMSAKTAATVLGMLPDKARSQAIVRMAQMQQFSPEMVQKIALILSRKMVALGEQSRHSFGGIKAVADLLNTVDTSLGASILADVEQENSALAISIRNFMFTFADFLDLPEPGLRELLGQLDKKTLAMALKGANDDLRNHFFKCMSSRAVEMLKEDIEALGPIRARDVSQAQQDAIAVARKLEADGKLTLKNEADDTYVV